MLDKEKIHPPDLKAIICRNIVDGKEHICEFWNADDEYKGYTGNLDNFNFIEPSSVRIVDSNPLGIQFSWKNGVECREDFSSGKILFCRPKRV